MSDKLSKNQDPLKDRLTTAFPAVGEFIWEDLENDNKREAFLRSEGLLGGEAVKETLASMEPELERKAGLQQLIEQYFPEDADFLADMDEEDALTYVYGMLLEMGEDPEEILHEFGVVERSEDEV